MVCLADVATTDHRFPARIYRFPNVAPKLGASVGAVALCAALAGCSAHQRQASTTTQPTAASAAPQTVAQSTATTAGVPLPPIATVAAATTQPAATLPGVKAIVVAAKGPARSDVRIGKSGGGLASWYGDRFHGRKTANGERFNMAAISAAHPSFPLPSYVRVTNVSNGRSIVVRVNDRGPFHGGRVIDVSRRAADVLGFRSHGVGTVKLDYVGKAPSSSDDQRLLASYQEFGRPALAPGTQMAGLAPVTDADLAAEQGSGGAYAVASRVVTRSASYVVASASSAMEGARDATRTTTEAARNAVRRILPERAPAAAASPTTVASASPAPAAPSTVAPSAYAPPQPVLASVPAEIASPSSARSKRVVVPGEPALASVAPPLRGSVSGSDVSSRISSSFDSFGPSTTTVETGASVRAEATR